MEKTRKLYKIGTLTQLLGITPRTIRYYDQFGLLPHVKRSKGNIRLFDDEDIQIIKQIKILQDEKSLPLEIIKDHLFGQTEHHPQTNAIVIVDNSALLGKIPKMLPIKQLPLKLTISNTQVIKTDKPTPLYKSTPLCNTEEEYRTLFEELVNKGHHHLYVLTMSSHLSSSYKNALAATKSMSKPVSIDVIDSKTTATSLGLMAEQIAQSIDNNDSKQKTSLLLNKLLPLSYCIACVSSLKSLLFQHTTEKKDPHSQLLNTLSNFNPIVSLDSKLGTFTILEFQKEPQESHLRLLELLHEEFIKRGRYISKIIVSNSLMTEEAIALTNTLKITYKNTAIELTENNAFFTSYLGPKNISIAIA